MTTKRVDQLQPGDRICDVDGCDDAAQLRGWCVKHYKRWRRHGDPTADKRRRPGTCSICGDRVQARGWCRLHYIRYLRNGDPLIAKKLPNGEPLKRLLAQITLDTDDCILFMGPLDRRTGYGRVTVEGRNVGAHRVSCEAAYGPAPAPNMHAAHSCRVRACVNPKHLRWATAQENNDDKITHGTTGRKLTDAQIRQAVLRHAAGETYVAIARDFDVDYTTVRHWIGVAA